MISNKTNSQRKTGVCVPLKIWSARNSVIDNLGIDPPVIKGDEVPLHRNNSSMQNTLNFKGMDT